MIFLVPLFDTTRNKIRSPSRRHQLSSWIWTPGQKGSKPDKGDKKTGNTENDFQSEDIPRFFWWGGDHLNRKNMKTVNRGRLFDNPPPLIGITSFFLDFDSWPNHSWHPVKKKNSENAEIDFQIEDIPKWFFWGGGSSEQ